MRNICLTVTSVGAQCVARMVRGGSKPWGSLFWQCTQLGEEPHVNPPWLICFLSFNNILPTFYLWFILESMFLCICWPHPCCNRIVLVVDNWRTSGQVPPWSLSLWQVTWYFTCGFKSICEIWLICLWTDFWHIFKDLLKDHKALDVCNFYLQIFN